MGNRSVGMQAFSLHSQTTFSPMLRQTGTLAEEVPDAIQAIDDVRRLLALRL